MNTNTSTNATKWDPTFQLLLRTALIGTDRNDLPPLTGPTGSGELISRVGLADREAAVLSAAAISSLYAQAGAELDVVSTEFNPADAEVVPRCGSAAQLHLTEILSGTRRDMLQEWLEIAATGNLIVSPELLPALLHAAKRDEALHDSIVAVIGRRGRWLAEQNPEWKYAAGGASGPLDPKVAVRRWETGARPQRIAVLEKYRQFDPEAARKLVESTWSSDPPEDRALFLAAFRVNLSPEDEPFLDSALDDRRREVRQVAANLLASLPASNLSQRIASRLLPLISLKRILIGPERLEVTLPSECDAMMLRDGIDTKPTEAGLGERAFWFRQLLGKTPPSQVCSRLQRTPAQLIQAVLRSEWKLVLLIGLRNAAVLFKDRPMLRELLKVTLSDWELLIQLGGIASLGLTQVLPADELETIAVEIMRSNAKLETAAGAATLVGQHLESWGALFSASVLGLLTVGMAQAAPGSATAGQFRDLLRLTARKAPVVHARTIIETLLQKTGSDEWHRYWDRPVQELESTLSFRADMAAGLRAAREA